MHNPEPFEKISFNSELNKAIDSMMGNELRHYTCQIFERNSEGHMKPFGSGVTAKIGGNCYILTASHVAEHMSDGSNLFIRRRGGYISIIGDIKITDIETSHGIDLAYIKLDPSLLPIMDGGYKFLPLSKFRKHSNLIDAAQYCVFGYPVDSTKLVDGQLVSQVEGFILEPAKPKVYQYYNYNPKICFALAFKGKGTDIRTGDDRKIRIEPYGLSGCGLWLLLPNYINNSLIIDYRLIGIMTEFHKGKYFCLAGNKIELLVDAISKFEGTSYNTRKPD